jgi:hypothetical protein
MASHPEPVDPVDEELEALLRHPVVRERLDEVERRLHAGDLGPGVAHAEIRKLVGLPPLQSGDRGL